MLKVFLAGIIPNCISLMQLSNFPLYATLLFIYAPQDLLKHLHVGLLLCPLGFIGFYNSVMIWIYSSISQMVYCFEHFAALLGYNS